MLYWG